MNTIIPLSKGHYVLVDPEDYDCLIAMGKWTFQGEGYAYRWDRSIKPHKCLLMHRVIMKTPLHTDTDHINGDKLDNRKSNLRIVNRTVNNYNKLTKGVETSIYWSGYVVRLTNDYKRIYIGRFKDLFEAQQASYEVKEQLMEGELS